LSNLKCKKFNKTSLLWIKRGKMGKKEKKNLEKSKLDKNLLVPLILSENKNQI